MTRKKLEAIYFTKHMQVGDTELDFYDWAIAYLLKKSLPSAQEILDIMYEHACDDEETIADAISKRIREE